MPEPIPLRPEPKRCPSRQLAVLGFDEPTVVPCVEAEGHDGWHRYFIEWGDDA